MSKKPITHAAYLNHANADELLAHRHLLPASVVRLLEATDRRIARWPDRFARANQFYREQAAIIAMADSTRADGLSDPSRQINLCESTFAKRFCLCGVGGRPCGLWKLCAYCAWCHKMNLQEKFLFQFYRHNWYFITIAYTGVVHVGDGLDGSLPTYWAAAVQALRTLVSEGLVNGVVWTEELHILSLLEGATQPHVHAVICADDLTLAHIEQLRAKIRHYRGMSFDLQTGQDVQDEHERVRLPVTTLTRHVEKEWHFANALSYLAKPLALAKPYLAEWEHITARDRSQVIFLNQQAAEVLGAYNASKYRRRQLDYKGVLDARSRTKFIGIPRQQRQTRAYRHQVRERLSILNLEHSGFYTGDDPAQWGQAIEHEALAAE